MTVTAVAPVLYPTLTIKNPSTTVIKYGDTLVLHAVVDNLPEGGKIVWTADKSGIVDISFSGNTCNAESTGNGDVTITAKVVDANGNAIKDANGNDITATQTLTSKAGFFQKLISFFKNLFGMNRLIPQSISKVIW